VTYAQICPRCGAEFADDDKETVVDAVVQHASTEHRHALDKDVVRAHLEGVHPFERDQ
jgi:hypothetical protein